MLEALRQNLLAYPLMVLFLTIGLGYMLSHLKVRGVGLGVATVLFVGLAIGAWGGGAFELPEIVSQFGLLLFVYTIGLEAGPAFFRILRRRGWGLAALAVGAVLAAAAMVATATRWLGLDPALAAGLFCGSLTNTPALAAVSEALRGTPGALSPAIGYSMAYPLGVILPILLVELTLRLGRVDVRREVQTAERQAGQSVEPPMVIDLRVTNEAVVGRPIGQLPLAHMPLRISRVMRDGEVTVATAETVLQLGDMVHVVGPRSALDQARELIGPEVENAPGLLSRRSDVDFRRMILSNPELVGRPLAAIGLDQYGATVTRLRRGDRDFVPTADTVLERGDRLRIVARIDQMDAIAKYVGDSFRGISEMDFLSLSVGAVLGLLLGMIRIPLPGGISLQLGLAGGPLLVALFLGWRGRTGPFIWSMPLAVNLTLRQLGLVLFFAAVGLRSGGHFAEAFAAQGPMLLAVGAIVTFVSAGILLWGSMWLLRQDFVSATGLLAGGQTQPALLTFAGERAQSEAPNAAYVAIMPTAMIAKILAAQLLLWVLAS